MSFRGSRKHVLDWVEHPHFATDFETMLSPSGARPVSGTWMPTSHDSPTEAQLESYGPRFLSETLDWRLLADWWLVHHRAANTPNWDLIAVCDFAGVRGLALIEAKANVPELKEEGKSLRDGASDNSRTNDNHIARAINEARLGLSNLVPGVAITRDSHYQLANRLAFAWKLASLGLPVVLVYLGFLGDHGITDAGPPLESHQQWHDLFWRYASPVVPRELFEHPWAIDGTPLWMFVRSRAVLSLSPPVGLA